MKRYKTTVRKQLFGWDVLFRWAVLFLNHTSYRLGLLWSPDGMSVVWRDLKNSWCLFHKRERKKGIIQSYSMLQTMPLPFAHHAQEFKCHHKSLLHKLDRLNIDQAIDKLQRGTVVAAAFHRSFLHDAYWLIPLQSLLANLSLKSILPLADILATRQLLMIFSCRFKNSKKTDCWLQAKRVQKHRALRGSPVKMSYHSFASVFPMSDCILRTQEASKTQTFISYPSVHLSYVQQFKLLDPGNQNRKCWSATSPASSCHAEPRLESAAHR